MLFAIDIDNTIAGGPKAYKTYIEYHNRDLGLGISREILETLPDYRSFLQLPEVVAYRRENEMRFQASRASCRISSQVILALEEIPGAVAGVTMLSSLGTIRYYTVRSNQEATRQWLSIKQFPHPDDVVFCENARHKLAIISQQKTEEVVVLIDDKFAVLAQAYNDLAQASPYVAENLRKRLVLIAFGVDVVPMWGNGLQVLTLPSWDSVTSLNFSVEYV